ncbi:hypothetical protein [Rahnella sp. AA]|nr:hypothetical protein [Rahnella sp. AA]
MSDSSFNQQLQNLKKHNARLKPDMTKEKNDEQQLAAMKNACSPTGRCMR